MTIDDDITFLINYGEGIKNMFAGNTTVVDAAKRVKKHIKNLEKEGET